MSLSIGTKLGRYEIRSKIGEGGMGEVYRARDEKLNRDVAIKVLPAALSENGDRLHRFEQEAQAAGTLNHPNILAVYDVGTHENSPYVVSELLEGESFREVLNDGPLATRKAINYAVQIAQGLAAAHEKGIIHRDLKPDNLFRTSDDRVKILDFGLAKLNQSSPSDAGQTDIATRRVHTDPGTVMGTVGYMSPEQVRAGTIDHRSDIFSFGAVLYEMLSGRRAFRGDSAIETLNAILKEEPAELTNSNPGIVPALERVVWHCLEKSPDRRFQSASDVAFALESLTEAGSHPSQQTLVDLAPASTPRRLTRERLMWLGLSSLLLVAVFALAYLYYFKEQPKPGLVKLSLATSEKITFPSNITISPDGRNVVFVASNPEGKRQLWLRSLESLTAQPLPTTEGAVSPFWSPDGRYIGYFAAGKLFRIDVSGGRPQVLCDVGEQSGGSWNREGVIIYGGGEGLYRVSAQGGTPVLATKISPREEAHRWPYFLPDGRHFVFLGDASTTEDHHLRIGSLDSTDSQIIMQAISRVAYAPPGYLLYVNQGALVTVPFNADSLKIVGDPITLADRIASVGDNHEFDFSVSNEGTLAYQTGSLNTQFVWFDRKGNKLGAVGEPAGHESIVLSPDGRSVAAGLLDADGRQSDVWLFDLSRNTTSRLTFAAQGDGTPIWSPDGTRIIFSSNRLNSGFVDLYEKAATGAGEEKLLFQSNAGKFATSWSHDGQSILFDSWDPNSKASIWLLNLTGDRQARPILQSRDYNQVQGQPSPDGAFIAYTSDESGRPEVYVQRLPPSQDKWQVSSTGGVQPRWSADGKSLYFIGEGKKLMQSDVNTGGGTFVSAIPRELFQASIQVWTGYSYAVTADGQRFLVIIPVETDEVSPLTIVLNWTTNLKQKQ